MIIFFLLSYCAEESVFNRDLETLREVLAKELEKGLEPLACGWCSLSIARSPKSALCFTIFSWRVETRYVCLCLGAFVSH